MPKKARISDWIILLLGVASSGTGWRDVVGGENGSAFASASDDDGVSPSGWGASESTLNFSHFYFSV